MRRRAPRRARACYPVKGVCGPAAAPAGPAATEYPLPSTTRGVAAQMTATLSLLTGLWVALSPVFLTLQHGGPTPTSPTRLPGSPGRAT